MRVTFRKGESAPHAACPISNVDEAFSDSAAGLFAGAVFSRCPSEVG